MCNVGAPISITVGGVATAIVTITDSVVTVIVTITAVAAINLTIIVGNDICGVVVGCGCDDNDVVATHGLHRTDHCEGTIVQYHLMIRKSTNSRR